MPGRMVLIDSGWFSAAVPGTGAAAFDVLEVKLASTQFAFLQSVKLLQHSLEVVTKIEEVRCSLKHAYGSYTSGSGGIAATVTKFGSSADAAAGLNTTRAGNTTQASAGAGTMETLWPGTFNLAAGEWEFTPIPELRPALLPSEGLILDIGEALEETVTVRGIIILELFG